MQLKVITNAIIFFKCFRKVRNNYKKMKMEQEIKFLKKQQGKEKASNAFY